MKKRIYLAGKMRGLKDFGFPVFHSYASILRAAGHEVFNPAEDDERVYGVGFAKSETGDLKDIKVAFDLRETLARDLMYILQQATAIALIPGWETSSGVAAELATAKAISLEIIYL